MKSNTQSNNGIQPNESNYKVTCGIKPAEDLERSEAFKFGDYETRKQKTEEITYVFKQN